MKYRIIPDIVKDQWICQLPTGATALEAAKQMGDCNVAAVVVADDQGKMVGIITERDLARRVVAQGLDPSATSLEAIMTRDPDTLSPDDTALDALEVMRVRKFRHLPVVQDGNVVGMVSIRDLYAAVKTELEESIRETEAFVFGDRYGA